jgi:crotonobetainyl-CoA:carnitine CoA-transferase CaiB-like acyl-CoA transferase
MQRLASPFAMTRARPEFFTPPASSYGSATTTGTTTGIEGINMSSNTLATPKAAAGFDVNARFRSVMSDLGLSPEDTGGTITFVGEDPIFPSVHRLGACIGIPIMAGAAGIADIWRQRSGRGQDLSLDLRKAIHGINPMYKFMPTINGYPYQLPYFIGNPMGFDLYRTKDGRFFLPTGAYPRLLNSMCTFLGCPPDKDSIATAVSNWDSAELDEAAAEKGLVFALVRTPEEWAQHPQSRHLAEKPVVEIVKIGDSDPEPFTPAARPLAGLRVLSATHVIAGNVMSRTLAEHGAEVLQIAHPEEFEHEALMQDPCAGFTSSAWLDFNQPDARQKAYELAAGADVFVESYRTRKISNLGLSPEELAARRPGIVYASARCYSYDGPWANRAGFDMEALCVTGFTTEEGTPDRPAFPPTHVMNDYIAGYLGAAGIQAALIRRAKEGGSYHVRVNLARCAMWFMSLGKFDKNAPAGTGKQHQILLPDTITAQTPYGELVRLAPPVKFSETKPYWEDPVLVVRGSSKAEWKDS